MSTEQVFPQCWCDVGVLPVQICPIGKVEEFLARVNSNEVIMKKYPEGRHDMLHDYEKDEVRKEIVTFIKSKLN